jgi:hypothetical protein
MSKTFTHSFTPEKLKTLDRGRLLTIRENAERKGVNDLVKMCDDELALRVRKNERKERASSVHPDGDIVTGYHFVCSKGRGVDEGDNGQFRSGYWVVAEANVVESLKYNAYLALHESKNEPSYRQGQIIGYRHSPRDMIDKDSVGIEFLVRETGDSYQWVGGGAGEKGYKWSKRSSRVLNAPGDENL